MNSNLIIDKLKLLINTYIETHPELKPYVTLQIGKSAMDFNEILYFEVKSYQKIYAETSSVRQRNKMMMYDYDDRVMEFIKLKYPELIKFNEYVIFLKSDDLTKYDLIEMNVIYRKLLNTKKKK